MKAFVSYKKSQTNVKSSLKLSVVLDRVKDPGNMGTIIRTAAAIGCHSILTTSESASPWSAKVLRSAMGAHFHVRIHDRVGREELERFVKSKRLVFADSKPDRLSVSYTEMVNLLDPSEHVCLVVGNETKGISRDIYDMDSARKGVVARIPLEKTIESLNCSVAFAVIAYEIKRILKDN